MFGAARVSGGSGDGWALIVDKFPRPPVETNLQAPKPGRCRPAASQTKCSLN